VPAEHYHSGPTKPPKKCLQSVHHSQLQADANDSYYQEHLCKNLKDKYTNLSTAVDKLVDNANSEIQNLQTKMFGKKLPQIM
jgi:hypothetical protein